MHALTYSPLRTRNPCPCAHARSPEPFCALAGPQPLPCTHSPPTRLATHSPCPCTRSPPAACPRTAPAPAHTLHMHIRAHTAPAPTDTLHLHIRAHTAPAPTDTLHLRVRAHTDPAPARAHLHVCALARPQQPPGGREGQVRAVVHHALHLQAHAQMDVHVHRVRTGRCLIPCAGWGWARAPAFQCQDSLSVADSVYVAVLVCSRTQRQPRTHYPPALPMRGSHSGVHKHMHTFPTNLMHTFPTSPMHTFPTNLTQKAAEREANETKSDKQPQCVRVSTPDERHLPVAPPTLSTLKQSRGLDESDTRRERESGGSAPGLQIEAEQLMLAALPHRPRVGSRTDTLCAAHCPRAGGPGMPACVCLQAAHAPGALVLY